MNDSVFVFTPTYTIGGVKQIWNETEESLEKLKFDHGTIRKLVGLFNPYSDGKLNILNQYQTARQLFLESDCQALLTVEHDMIIPEDGLNKLWALDVPVAYGVYMLRHGANVLNAWRYVGRQGVGMSLTLFPDQLADAFKKVVIEVSGVGFGMTLIKREVLKELDFHPADNGHPLPDVPFAVDCLRRGFVQKAHFGVLCDHIDDDGTVLKVYKEGRNMVNKIRVKVLRSFNAYVDGQTQEFKVGLTEFPEDRVADFVRAGYIQIEDPEPAVKVVQKPKRKSKTVKVVSGAKDGDN